MDWAEISLGYHTKRHLCKRGSVAAVQYRNEVLHLIVKLYNEVVDPSFILMDDNACPHRAGTIDDFLESKRIALME